MEAAFLASVKHAFHIAKMGNDCNFNTLNTKVVAVRSVAQRIFERESGNEYLRLDKRR